MELVLHLLSDFTYDSTLRSFPIVLELKSATPEKISRKVDVIEMSLEHTTFDCGVSRHSQGKIGSFDDTVQIETGLSHFLLRDVLEFDDDSLNGGEYILTVRLLVHEATTAGFRPRELKASRMVTVMEATIS
jgi:hypothetical protein